MPVREMGVSKYGPICAGGHRGFILEGVGDDAPTHHSKSSVRRSRDRLVLRPGTGRTSVVPPEHARGKEHDMSDEQRDFQRAMQESMDLRDQGRA
ncbi:hypothetical protein [Mobilicoccus massiliensis]|uniref:hypothetical protein n=1 Tax=Mobilicoccus massiliensis TaxID=1522310 RepID=UPI0005917588|nr:hypothetical protein [Mobilicoccus massiliensis]